jgi:hypothetical protein
MTCKSKEGRQTGRQAERQKEGRKEGKAKPDEGFQRLLTTRENVIEWPFLAPYGGLVPFFHPTLPIWAWR